MKIYLVGGAIRDRLLGLGEAADSDFVVVGSSSSEMLKLGFLQVGKDFPVFLHPKTKCEYALARRERKVKGGYTGFEFDAAKTITLEQDLSRRDLTINAIAEDEAGNLIDPFAGKDDLDNGILRHVSAAFSEDPVRILRVARFAARFKPFGFKVAHQTHKLMLQMVASGEVDFLVPERVFQELNKALNYQTPSAFFKVLSACGAYAKIFHLADQNTTKHQNNFEFLDNLKTDEPQVKFAVWLIYEDEDAITSLCKTIKPPKKYRQLALLANRWHNFAKTFKTQSSNDIFNFFKATDALRQTQRFENLITVFNCLNINTTPITTLKTQLQNIKIKDLNQKTLPTAIIQKKQQIIKQFLAN